MKKYSFVFLFICLAESLNLYAQNNCKNAVVKIEAEDCGLYGTKIISEEENEFDNVSVFFPVRELNMVEVEANIPEEGDYLISLNVLNKRDYDDEGNPFPEKYRAVQIEVENEEENILASSQRLISCNTFTDVLMNNVFHFSKGINVFYVQSLKGGFYVDYIEILPAEESDVLLVKPSKIPVNENATENTRRVLSYLVDMQGKGILSGQQVYDRAAPEIKALNKVLERNPAVLGIDLIDFSPTRVQYGTKSFVENNAIKWWKDGGLVSCCWHWNAPMNLKNNDEQYEHWYDGFRTQATSFDLQKALNDRNSDEYKAIIRDIDAITVPLKKMQKEGVVLLWRPLHEASGGWFWWGAHGADDYIRLYRLLYEQLTNVHGINNLLWVWNGQDPLWYPGDDVVDIISDDIYPPQKKYMVHDEEYSKLRASSVLPKIVALSENGTLPDVEKLQSKQVYWSWFCTWDHEFCIDGKKQYSSKYTDLNVLKKYYADPYLITREELPSFTE